jgi:hypothetical protein
MCVEDGGLIRVGGGNTSGSCQTRATTEVEGKEWFPRRHASAGCLDAEIGTGVCCFEFLPVISILPAFIPSIHRGRTTNLTHSQKTPWTHFVSPEQLQATVYLFGAIVIERESGGALSKKHHERRQKYQSDMEYKRCNAASRPSVKTTICD